MLSVNVRLFEGNCVYLLIFIAEPKIAVILGEIQDFMTGKWVTVPSEKFPADMLFMQTGDRETSEAWSGDVFLRKFERFTSKYEDMIDHRSYAHNLSSCEIKA